MKRVFRQVLGALVLTVLPSMVMVSTLNAQSIQYDLEEISVLESDATTLRSKANQAKVDATDAASALSTAKQELKKLETELRELPGKIRTMESSQKVSQNNQQSYTQQASSKRQEALIMEPQIRKQKRALNKAFGKIETFDTATVELDTQRGQVEASLTALQPKNDRFSSAANNIKAAQIENQTVRSSLKEIRKKYQIPRGKKAAAYLSQLQKTLTDEISALETQLADETAQAFANLENAKKETEKARKAAASASTISSNAESAYNQAKQANEKIAKKTVQSINNSIKSWNQKIVMEVEKRKSLQKIYDSYLKDVRTPAWGAANAKGTEIAKLGNDLKDLKQKRKDAEPKQKPAFTKKILELQKIIRKANKAHRELVSDAKKIDKERDKKIAGLKAQKKVIEDKRKEINPIMDSLRAEAKNLPNKKKQAKDRRNKTLAQYQAALESTKAANARLRLAHEQKNIMQTSYNGAGLIIKRNLKKKRAKEKAVAADCTIALSKQSKIEQNTKSIEQNIAYAMGHGFTVEQFREHHRSIRANVKQLNADYTKLTNTLAQRALDRKALSDDYKRLFDNHETLNNRYATLSGEADQLETNATAEGDEYVRLSGVIAELLTRKDNLESSSGDLAQYRTYYDQTVVFDENARKVVTDTENVAVVAEAMLAKARELYAKVLATAKQDAISLSAKLALEAAAKVASEDANTKAVDDATRLGQATARRETYRSSFNSAQAAARSRGLAEGKRDGSALGLGKLLGYQTSFSNADSEVNEEVGRVAGNKAGIARANEDLTEIAGNEAQAEEERQWQKELEAADIESATSLSSVINATLQHSPLTNLLTAGQRAQVSSIAEDTFNAFNDGLNTQNVLIQTEEEDPYADKNIPGVVALGVEGMPENGYPNPPKQSVSVPSTPAVQYGLQEINDIYESTFSSTYKTEYKRVYTSGDASSGVNGYRTTYRNTFASTKSAAYAAELATGLEEVKTTAENNGDKYGYKETYSSAAKKAEKGVLANYAKAIAGEQSIAVDQQLIDSVDQDISAKFIASGKAEYAPLGKVAGAKVAEKRGYGLGEPEGYEETYTQEAIENATELGAKRIADKFAQNVKIKPLKASLTGDALTAKQGQIVSFDLNVGNFGGIASEQNSIVVVVKPISGIKLITTRNGKDYFAAKKELKLPSITALTDAKIASVARGKILGGQNLKVQFEIFETSTQGRSLGKVFAEATVTSTLRAYAFYDKNWGSKVKGLAFKGAKTFYIQQNQFDPRPSYNSENVICILNGFAQRKQFEYRVTTNHPRLDTEGRWILAGLEAAPNASKTRNGCFGYPMKARNRDVTDFEAPLTIEIRNPRTKEVIFQKEFKVEIRILQFN